MSHSAIHGRAPRDDVERAVFDIVGAYAWQETLLFLVFFNETREFALWHAESNVCQLGFYKGINVLVVPWGWLSQIFLYWRGSVCAWPRVLRQQNTRSSLFGVNS
jgi:hypothetical protein